nr:HAMP domain-containing sensor histidine kinase [Candidatus Gracilibacteria bacterium]
MTNNLKSTKKHLTIIFSIIVFLLILFLEVTYFTSKYIKEVQYEKNDFNIFVNLIENRNFTIDDIISGPSKFRDNRFERGENIGTGQTKIRTLNGDRFQRPQNFVNFILVDSNKKIISSDTKDEISDSLLNSILSKDTYFELTQKSGYLIKKKHINSGNYDLIMFKKLRYSFIDYLDDLLGLIIVSILFSILFYFIGYKFVSKVLKPVEENIKEMSDFIHNVGHELKTPISVIDSNIQLINDMKTYDKEMTIELKNEVIRLNSLIDSLINLTNIDTLKDSEEINLKDAIGEVINEFKYKISEKKIEVKINIPKTSFVNTNKSYFFMFLSNIIGNAIKYNIENGKIDISYKNSELKIKDSGIGIEKNDLGKIFDRFYKADKSRNSEGFGIGLSLVKKIADIYKWKLNVSSENGKGTEFKIKF